MHTVIKSARVWAILTVTLLTGSFAFAGLEVGNTLPMADYKMTNVDGKTVTLADVKGEKGTVVAFWCNHCPWVVKWRDRMVEVANDYSGKGFGFVAINSNDPNVVKGDSMEAMKEYSEKYNYSFPYVQDEGSKLAKEFGATKTPHIYVFNADNQLVYIGAIDDNANNAKKVEKTYLRDALDAVAMGEMPKVTESKALGCGIKWYKN